MLGQPHHDGTMVSTSAAEPGETVTVFVRAPVGTAVAGMHVRFTEDGEPRYAEGVVDRQEDGETWWRARFRAHNPVTPYRFLLETAAGPRWLNALGMADHEVPDNTDFRVVTHAPPPSWSSEAVVYEIFPDRFARSAAAAGRPLPEWAIPCAWDEPVIGRGPETPYQFYGGDLDGVVERLDHIGAVGANTLYLTPIFPARSNHRYDAAAFDHVDPLLGGDAALRRLADAVHARGWRLIGDVTTNHTGDAHPWFTAAISDVSAAERDLYYFDAAGDYEAWWGIKTLPKLNWASPDLRRRFLDGPSAVARRWLLPPYGLDGWRVDVANMTGRLAGQDLAHEVAGLLREAAVDTRPDALVVAEHMHDFTGDVDRGGWHGAMNYSGVSRPLWGWLRGDDPVSPGVAAIPGDVPRRDGVAALRTMRLLSALVSWRTLTTSWNIVSSHDTARIRTMVGDPARVEIAAGMMLALPGVPMLYAGDEIGLRGVNGEDGRRPLPWHRPETWDTATLARYRALVALRHRLPALRHGGLRWAYADADCLVFLRETPTEAALVMARRAAGPPVRLAGLPVLENVYGDAPALRPDAAGAVTLPTDGPTFQVWCHTT
jgi:alpha-glucosidase